jgi:hypothetical protein
MAWPRRSTSVSTDRPLPVHDSDAGTPTGLQHIQVARSRPQAMLAGRDTQLHSRTRTRKGRCAGSMPARASSQVLATVSGQGGQGTNSMAMAYISEARCSVRRKRWWHVTVQPSNTQTHRSRCRNETTSTRMYAARIDSHLFVASYGLIIRSTGFSDAREWQVRRLTTPLELALVRPTTVAA